MYTLKSVNAQVQKFGRTEQELRDYVLRRGEEFYKNTAHIGTTFTRWIQLKLGCSWPAAETVIRWAKTTPKADAIKTLPNLEDFALRLFSATEDLGSDPPTIEATALLA